MLMTILGLLLLLLPLLCFKLHKALGCIVVVQLAIGLITQLFGVFTYPVVFGLNLVVALFLVRKVRFRINWTVIAVAAILLFSFYGVHYNYTGDAVFSGQQLDTVEGMHYPLPYASDEWYGASIAQHAIETGGLPLDQPLREDIFFINLQIAFHSLLAEVFMLLDLDVVWNFGVAVMLFSTAICLVVYALLMLFGVRPSAAIFGSLFTSYVASSGNIFTLWNVIPASVGILTLLLAYCFLVEKNTRYFFLFGFLTLIFYPPFGVFLLPAAFVGLSKEYRMRFMYVVLGSGVGLFLVALLLAPRLQSAWLFVWNKVYYLSYTPIGIAYLFPWVIIPPLCLVFVLFSYGELKKRTWFMYTLGVGLAYWLVYHFTIQFFIISQERVVYVAAVLLVIACSLGFHRLSNLWKKYDRYVVVGLLLLFAVFSFTYTEDDRFRDMPLIAHENGNVYRYVPGPTASAYFDDSDADLFSTLEPSVFLSDPWKSTVISIALGHTPTTLKSGTFGYKEEKYPYFLNQNCDGKKKILDRDDIAYVYGAPEECSFLRLIGISDEGYHLYVYDEN